MLSIRRITAARPALRNVRFFADKPSDGPIPTGSPDNFGKREKANEDYYIRQHEKEQLEKLHQAIKQRESEIGDLKQQAEKLSK